VRPDPTEQSQARRRVQGLLEKLAEDAGQRPFERPWELRAFALAIAAHNAGRYDWSAFQLALIDSIRRWEESESGVRREHAPWSYYDHWLEALETTLSEKGVLTGGELDERTKAVLATPRDPEVHRAHPDPIAVDPRR
jgi:nitrile hydratase accessory protein